MTTQFAKGREKTGGKVKGSRNKLTGKFLEELCADFEANGAEAIRVARVESPSNYLRTIASVLPKELDINDNRLKDIDDDELDAIIERVRTELASRAGVAGSGTEPAAD